MNRSIAAFAAGLLACTPVQAAKISDGWGGYKFGMSPDQARAVPGRSWGPLKGAEPIALMEALKPVTQNGVSYDLSLWFRPASTLDQIFLSSSKTTTWEECGQIFLAALKHGESDYGAFAPLRADAKPVSVEGGVTSSVELHDVPDAKSRYQLLHTIEKEIPFYAFDARRVEEGKSFAISSDWSVKQKGQTKGECFTKLNYEKAG